MKCDWCDKPPQYVYAMQYADGTYSIDFTCVEHRPPEEREWAYLTFRVL